MRNALKILAGISEEMGSLERHTFRDNENIKTDIKE
jgi:hypothetical protein